VIKSLLVDFAWPETFVTKFENLGVIGLRIQTSIMQDNLQANQLIMSLN
jgi:hypothetical protein